MINNIIVKNFTFFIAWFSKKDWLAHTCTPITWSSALNGIILAGLHGIIREPVYKPTAHTVM